MQIGKYQIERELGRGATSIVYAAFDAEAQRRVALKALPPTGEGAERARHPKRILREVQVAQSIGHSGVPKIFEFFTVGDTHYIAQEFCEGQTLRHALDASGPMEPERAVGIALQVLSVLEAAHARGILHRDVKPENVLLVPGGSIRLMDFGVAYDVENAPRLTRAGEVQGTPAYMSPEQAQGEPVDARSDLFSVGVLLHEMLTGRRPFQAASVLGTLYAVVYQEPKIERGLPDALRHVVCTALAKEPSGRFPSAAHMRKALEAIPQAPRPAPVRRRRFMPYAVAAPLAVAVLVLCLALLTRGGVSLLRPPVSGNRSVMALAPPPIGRSPVPASKARRRPATEPDKVARRRAYARRAPAAPTAPVITPPPAAAAALVVAAPKAPATAPGSDRPQRAPRPATRQLPVPVAGAPPATPPGPRQTARASGAPVLAPAAASAPRPAKVEPEPTQPRREVAPRIARERTVVPDTRPTQRPRAAETAPAVAVQAPSSVPAPTTAVSPTPPAQDSSPEALRRLRRAVEEKRREVARREEERRAAQQLLAKVRSQDQSTKTKDSRRVGAASSRWVWLAETREREAAQKQEKASSALAQMEQQLEASGTP